MAIVVPWEYNHRQQAFLRQILSYRHYGEGSIYFMQASQQPILQSVEHPTGVSLKAAYLLLQEMKQSPDPPTVDGLALLLDNKLHFGHLIREIHSEAWLSRNDYDENGIVSQGMLEYDAWASQMLD